MTAPAVPLPIPQPRRRRRLTPDTRTALLYLLPAFLVMGIITFYPLLFQTWMSFTDFRLEEPQREGSARTSSASTTTPRSSRAS